MSGENSSTTSFSTDLLEGLDLEQAEAVASVANPLCVLAGAGSGKTRVLTRRVARRILDGSAEAQHTLVLTFTRKAADELRTRLHHLGVEDEATIGTFHAVAYAQLRRRWLDANRAVPVIASQPLRIVETALTKLSMDRMGNQRAIAAEISWAKSNRLVPENYEEGVRSLRHRPPISATHFARVYDAYEIEKRKRKVMDFDDLLLLLTDALGNDKAFATSQRWKFRHFFVDEFQDVNRAQFDLLQAWMGDGDDLFVVGDANQAIYGWNGADASYFTEIKRHFPTIATVRLQSNYRSTGHVLAAANAILPHANGRQPEQTNEFSVPEHGLAPTVRMYADEETEAREIARGIRLAHGRNWQWSDIAVLVRTNAQRHFIEAALDAVQIPYRSSGGAAWLYRGEVRNALDHLRALPKGRLAERAADIAQMSQEAEESDRAQLEELLNACRTCLAEDPTMSIADFLSWIEVASRNDGPAAASTYAGAVTVTTFHRAKGLEWPVVFLAGIEDGLVPLGNGMEGTQLDEERRLFYVAVTRAREELHCSWAQKRMSRDFVRDNAPSPWLALISGAGENMSEKSADTVVVHSVIDESRAVLHLDPEKPDPARVALEQWRASRAKLSGVDAKLILSDRAVDAIIDLRPINKEELALIEDFGAVRAAAVGDEIIDLLDVDSKP